MPKVSNRKESRVIELHVALEPTAPLVWRRLRVEDCISMYQFHEILQVSMGWMNSHLFFFKAPGMTITEDDPDNDWIEDEFKDARKTKIRSVLSEAGDAVSYEYDFGDSWTHTIRFERVVDEDEIIFELPRCIGGENACPPEDCGGFYGFERIKNVLAKQSGDEYATLLLWLDTYYPDYDPREFSQGSVNKILKIGASRYLKLLPKMYR
jgi:hypothetical protein